jgi:UDP-N-acetylmuramoylalanine--D-glutamate ligase
MEISELNNKKILIAGYGVEGRVTEKFLKKFLPRVKYDITDIKNGNNYLDKQDTYDLVIKSPGIPSNKINVPYTTASNLFFANINPLHHIIGVTGTKGKSTTSSLIHHILKNNGFHTELIGNIGKPMLSVLLKKEIRYTVYIVELSSYQLEDINYSPNISVYVSLFREHLNYHGSEENYFMAKNRMIKFSNPSNYMVYNPQFKQFINWAKKTQARTIPFDLKIKVPSSPLIGEHNKTNIQGAITTCRILGINSTDALRAIKTFKPLPHRLEKVGVFNNITFYDDAISTTPESTIQALKALSSVDTILLGGEDRGYDFKKLAEQIVKDNIQNVVLFPKTGLRIKEELIKKGYANEILETDSMNEAVKFSYQKTKAGKICLLSTASPSYSLWRNFEHKGEEFRKFIIKYASVKKK